MSEETNDTDDAAGIAGASADTQPQPVPAVALPPDPMALAAQTKTAFPNLDQRALEILYVCSTFAARKGQQNAPSPEMASKKLNLIKGWTDEDIRNAHLLLMGNVEEGLTALVEEFLTATLEPGDSVPAEFDFQLFPRRLQKEQAQQYDRNKIAKEMVTLVMNLSGRLGIPNPDVAVDQTAQQTPKQPEESTLASLNRTLRGIAGQFVTVSRKEPQTAQPADAQDSALPGWLTPPVLTADDPDVQAVQIVIADEVNVGTDARLIWANLNALGLSQSDVVGYLRRVAEKARKEIDQSRSILQRVEMEYGEHYALQLEAFKRLRDVIEGNIDFNPKWGPDTVQQEETR